jgi:hypothetical protein
MDTPFLAKAPPLQSFVEQLQAAGLTPVELTPQDLVQSISIMHNVGTGRFSWTVHKIAEQAIGLLAMVIHDMWRYWFKSSERPPLTSGHAKVCIDLDGDILSMSFGLVDPAHPELPPVADPLVAASMLTAALFFLTERVNGSDFNPLDALLGNLHTSSRP